MVYTGILLALLVAVGIWEYRKHQQTIFLIPNRIHVNGTRGKSSVTRLITGGLQAGGLKTMGKTTGTRPCLIHPDGREVPIGRVGKANVIEQLKVARHAVAHSVEALVVECMAVLPQHQRMAERQMIHSTVGVLTNVRADHLDEMGPTIEDVARSLANTVPYHGVFFTCEEKYLGVFQEVASRRNTQLYLVKSGSVTDDMMRGFSYLEHRDNVALALAVCGYFKVSESEALGGMKRCIPDVGVLRMFRIHHYEKEIEFVNAFAANDPDSYLIIWDLLKPHFMPEKNVIVIVNCRKDRIQRTEGLADLIVNKVRADHFILVGEFTLPLYNKAISLGLPRSKISNLADLQPEDIFQHVVTLSDESSLVLGIGNIVGFGEELVSAFTNRGKEYVYGSS